MNWDAIGAIGQILGSVGVLISIGYLAVQVGHARDAVSRSARQVRYDLAMRVWSARAAPESARRFAKMHLALGGRLPAFVAAAIEKTGVTEEEAFAEYFEQYAWWFTREHNLQSLDQLSMGERAATESGARFAYGNQPVSRLWYETVKDPILNPEVVRRVDELIARSG